MLNSIVSVLDSGGAGGGGSYESIATFNPSGVSTVTFSSIPSTYTSLQVRISAIGTDVGGSIYMRPNSNSGANYTTHRLYGDGTSANATGSTGASQASVFGAASGISSTQPAAIITDIIDYTSTTKTKTLRTFSGVDKNGSGEVLLISNLWNQTTAISSLEVYSLNTFSSGTTISLYGIKGA